MKRYITDNEVTTLRNAFFNADCYGKYKWCFINSHKNEKGSWVDCGHIYLELTKCNKNFFIKKIKNDYYIYNEQKDERWLLTNAAKELLNISE